LPSWDKGELKGVDKRSPGQPAFVSQMVEEQAAATPDAVALTSGGRVLTYGELEARANRLAHRLRSLGVGPDVLVAICLPRSTELAIGALGILKAGGTYLPLDPSYPPDRLGFILRDARPPVLLAPERVAERLPRGPWRVLSLDAEECASHPSTPPKTELTGQHLAYVIYTSGSTGRPRGVQVTHEGLLNLVLWHRRAFAVGPKDRATLFASPGFDAAVWELWPYLTSGASVHVPDEDTRLAAESLRDWLVAQGITLCFLPAMLADAVVALPWPDPVALRVLLTGADTVRRHPPRSLPFAVVNNYGPTECTVVATSGPLEPDPHPANPPSIGRPISNAVVYILTEDLQGVPFGATGELYVGGRGVARGYLNLPALTAERYIPDPFGSEPGARLYRTGDLARQLDDGQILLIGRCDKQVKIRGHRVEPDEIVAVLDQHESVRESLVVARELSPEDRRLVAYIVPAPGARPTAGSLRQFLGRHLPEHQIPSTYVSLGSFPLTAHGKVDPRALPEPDAMNTLRDEAFTAPRTKIEKRLAEILAPLLGVTRVGVDDNFFVLGGHSLLGAQVIARVRDTFGIELSLRSIFDAPTVAHLSAEIERLILAGLESVNPAEDGGEPRREADLG
jgi:amino acid adenylation domain-containing protein